VIRFSVEMGPLSKLLSDPVEAAVHAEEEGFRAEETAEQANTLVLEGQGIMVYDRETGGESHVS
jgi:serine/threonine-protein kinase RIM15